MDRETLVEAAGRQGIDVETAGALHEDLVRPGRRAVAHVRYLVFGGVFGWAALTVSAHEAAFPLLLMVGGIGFIALAIWLARVDSPIRRLLNGPSNQGPSRPARR